MKKHPDKHIQAALDYALSQGWHFRPSKGLLLADFIAPLSVIKNI